MYDNNVGPEHAADLLLPKGTVCGVIFNAIPACVPGFGGCPTGWTEKEAYDANAPFASNKWAWCEYDDQFNVCPGGSCVNSSLPDGMTCGLTHNSPSEAATGLGNCLGVDTRFGCPPGFVHSPSFYDDGRPAGEGLGWCAKLPTPTCTAPQTACGTKCVNLNSDRSNCGACNVRCGTTEVCASGSCTCSGPRCL